MTTDLPICHMAVDTNGELWAATHKRPERYYQMYGYENSGCMHFNRPPGHADPSPPTFTVSYHYLGNGTWESWSGFTGNTSMPAPISMDSYCYLWTWVSSATICKNKAHPVPPISDIQRWLEESNLSLLPPSPLHDIHGALAIDPQGAVWTGSGPMWTESGSISGRLLVFEQGSWSEVKPEVQPPHHNVSTLWPGHEGHLWAGDHLGVYRWDNGRVTMSTNLGAVASLVQDWEGRVWAGLVHGGVARLDGDTWTRFDFASGALPSNLVTSMVVDTARQRLYIGTHGGLAMFDGQKWTSLGNPIADMPMWINTLAIDDDGRVWVGYYSGPTRDRQFSGYLLCYANGEWEHIPLPAQAAVGALLVDRTGRLWVGLIPAGFLCHSRFHPWREPLDIAPVWSYHDGEWRPIGAAQGLGVPAVFALAEDHDGTIWAAGAICVSAIDPASVWGER